MKLTDLFKGPEQWCKGRFARNIKGESVQPDSVEAYQWCVMGRWLILATKEPFNPLLQACNELFPTRKSTDFGTMSSFNDHPDTTFDDVQAVLERAEQIRTQESK